MLQLMCMTCMRNMHRSQQGIYCSSRSFTNASTQPLPDNHLPVVFSAASSMCNPSNRITNLSSSHVILQLRIVADDRSFSRIYMCITLIECFMDVGRPDFDKL